MAIQMDYQLRDFCRHSGHEQMCHWCDEDAEWIADRDVTHGGGEDGPEWDAPVFCWACDLHKDNSQYMLPVHVGKPTKE